MVVAELPAISTVGQTLYRPFNVSTFQCFQPLLLIFDHRIHGLICAQGSVIEAANLIGAFPSWQRPNLL